MVYYLIYNFVSSIICQYKEVQKKERGQTMQTIFTLKQQVLNGEVITVPVQNSSNISTYSYNPQTKIFSVLFKRGTLYKYSDVGLEVAFKFLNTSMVGGSIGKLFRSELLNRYTYTRLDVNGGKKYTVEV